MDYWRESSDSIYYLLLALPHLPTDLQTSTRAYIQNELQNYPPWDIAHIGWSTGASREFFDLPPEEEAAAKSWGPRIDGDFNPIRSTPSGNTASRFLILLPRPCLNPARSVSQILLQIVILQIFPLCIMPILRVSKVTWSLGKKAGYAESQLLTPSGKSVKSELDTLLALRASSFSKDDTNNNVDNYCHTLAPSRNFMYLVPELADYLRMNAITKVQEALQEYTRVAPYWFVEKTEQTVLEGVLHPIYDVNAVFQAKALILKEPRRVGEVPGRAHVRPWRPLLHPEPCGDY